MYQGFGDTVSINMLNLLRGIRRWVAQLTGSIERTAQKRVRAPLPKRDRDQATKPDAQINAELIPVKRDAGELLDAATMVYAIGDIHGRADLLLKLLDRIEDDAKDFDGEVHLVFLGDYIDRGLQSRQVVDVLLSERVERYQTHFLKGNHEDALLSFLSDPGFGPKWAAYGGRETLVSYGVKPPRSLSLNNEWDEAHEAFLKAFPNAHQTFFRTLPTQVQIGGYGFVHAGLKPGKNFADQEDHDLMWIRDEFLDANSSFDVMVVHGHTPIDTPHHDHRRINVDTGAYFTGRLTAAKLTGQSVGFIATER